MDKIAMVDMDGVVINAKYETNKNISAYIGELAKKIKIVPNSDTPIKRLQWFFQKSLNIICDTLVGEYGAIIQFKERTVYAFSGEGIKEYANEIREKIQAAGGKVLLGNAPLLVKNNKKWPKNQRLIIMDSYRERSVGMFILKSNNNGRLLIDPEWWEICESIISKIQLPSTLGKFFYNPAYGIAISNARGTTKKRGYEELKKAYTKKKFYMIGDSNGDIIDDPNVTLLAVGNATPLLKKRAVFVSNFYYTKGLEECLGWIANDK